MIITKKNVLIDPRYVASLKLAKVIQPLVVGEDGLHHFVGSQPTKRGRDGFVNKMAVGNYPIYSNDKDEWKISNRKIKEIHTSEGDNNEIPN